MQIYGTTLASIICRNSDRVTESSRYVMRKMDAENPMENCAEIDTFKFDAWNVNESGQKLPSVKMSTAETNIKIMSKATKH